MEAAGDLAKEIVRLLQTDRPMHDALVRLLNALADGEEIQNVRRMSRVPGGARTIKVYRRELESKTRGERSRGAGNEAASTDRNKPQGSMGAGKEPEGPPPEEESEEDSP